MREYSDLEIVLGTVLSGYKLTDQQQQRYRQVLNDRKTVKTCYNCDKSFVPKGNEKYCSNNCLKESKGL